MMKPSTQLLNLLLFELFSLLLHCNSLFIKWMLKMHYFMVISVKMFISLSTRFIDPSDLSMHASFIIQLYDLKLVLQATFHCLSLFLLRLVFTGSTADTPLFILCTYAFVMFIPIYTDDITLIRTANAPFDALITLLNVEFSMKYRDSDISILGLKVHQSDKRGFL